ncbi:hypothetical protein RB195_014828 [Necator americanus]|uniref:Disintegrin n=1 Tax=Necator americanus TaxID=51031 RepID=A0ABR1E4I4_NECAM
MFLCFRFCWVVSVSLGLCESEGTCRQCVDLRYSYYRCGQQADCFLGETCDRGFCCPAARSTIALQSEAPRILQQSLPDNRTVENSHNAVVELCPDGSTWTKRCGQEADCNATKQFCAEGKCCATCAQRRRKFLDDSAQRELAGLAIPQCEADGRYFRARCDMEEPDPSQVKGVWLMGCSSGDEDPFANHPKVKRVTAPARIVACTPVFTA